MRFYHWLAIGVALFAAFYVGTCNKKPIELLPIEDPYLPEIRKKEAIIQTLEKQLDSVRNIPHDTIYKTMYRNLNNVRFLSADSAVLLFDALTGRQQ